MKWDEWLEKLTAREAQAEREGFGGLLVRVVTTVEDGKRMIEEGEVPFEPSEEAGNILTTTLIRSDSQTAFLALMAYAQGIRDYKLHLMSQELEVEDE
jgi:hypothetical protein